VSSLSQAAISAGVLILAACATTNSSPVLRRGPVAFYYGPALTEEGLTWYSQFDVLVTHDPLPREQVERLHAAGTRLVLYEWSVAFYESRATEWQRSLLRDHRGLLHDTPLSGGAGSSTAAAWYFDPASPDHGPLRAADVIARLSGSGYDGVFLDTTTVESVHPVARSEYHKRNASVPYDVAYSRFLRELRARLPNGIIFTNQGYRSAEHYLPWVDWDLTESLITRPAGDSWQVRPWNDPADPWNSIHFVMRTMIEPVAARYPHVRFGHLNYNDVADPETARLVIAAGHLFGGDGYVAVEGVEGPRSPDYFVNPGKPAGARFDHENGQTSYRFFDQLLIVVTSAAEPVTITMPCGNLASVPSSPDRPRAFFFDNSGDCGRPR
jgi:hypothetical protein